MKMNRAGWVGCLLVLACGRIVAATDEEVTLKTGSDAPKLKAGKWVQGEPVKEFSRDKAYLVEFWATWCGPCRATIPHLNDLHKKYESKGLVVIGQNCWERDESKVPPFLKEMGDKMSYRVAMDDKTSEKEGAMAKNWMGAAGQNGIPAAFLVDKQGKIAWIGHPMQLKDSTIDQVLAGTYDLKQAAAEAEKQQNAEVAARKAYQQISQAMKSKDWNKAESLLDDLGKQMNLTQEQLNPMRLQMQIAKGDLDAAATISEKISDAQKDSAMVQNQLAWTLLTQDGLKGKALEIAAKIAERADQAAGGKDAAVLDTLARARFMQDNKAEAIRLQRKAIELADGDLKTDLRQTLESYQEGKLPSAE